MSDYNRNKMAGEEKAVVVGIAIVVFLICATIGGAIFAAAMKDRYKASNERMEFNLCMTTNHTMAECSPLVERTTQATDKK